MRAISRALRGCCPERGIVARNLQIVLPKCERKDGMYKGIYIAASGAVLKQAQLEVITQNLANANTTGFKKDGISFKDYLLPLDPSGAPDGRVMSEYSATKIDFSNGTSVRTGNPLNISIEGPGLIALEGDRYTRRGDLQKSQDGYLATHDGIKVLGNSGPIKVPEGDIVIDQQGKISVISEGLVSQPAEIDTIKILDFSQSGTVQKTGDGLFTATGTGTQISTGVHQGHVEASNVDVVKEMVHMIEMQREFESYQKVIQSFDDAMAKVNTDMGRL
jgi:flagellar basal-body rod protein FlgG